jgi:hypothetical protein
MLAEAAGLVELRVPVALEVVQQQVRLQLLQQELLTQAAVVAAVVLHREQARQAAPALLS